MENNLEEHYRKLERMYLSAPINEYFKPKIVISYKQAKITTLIRPDFFHATKAVHGSVYFKVLDDSAFFSVQSLVQEALVLTVSFTTYFEQPILEGEIQATGQVVMASRNLFIAESKLVNNLGEEVARGSGTFARVKIPLTSNIGYI